MPGTSAGNRSYSDEQMLDAIRAVRARPVTVAAYLRERPPGAPCAAAIRKRFGGWPLAVDAAGLVAGRGHLWTPDECLTAVRRVAVDLGRAPNHREYDAAARAEGLPCYKIVAERVGWAAAIEAAGFEPARPTLTAEDCLAAVRSVAEGLGHAPTVAEYVAAATGNGLPARSAIVKHVGSWRQVIREAGLDNS